VAASDARLHDWPEPQPKGKRGPKPKKGERQPAAFFATDLDATPEQILEWVVMRCGIEVTFAVAYLNPFIEN